MTLEREAIRDLLTALAKEDAAVQKARKPYDDTHARAVRPFVQAAEGIEEQRQKLLEQLGPDVEIVGTCEFCDRLLLTGDPGHRCADGPVLCEACSPTYADALQNLTDNGPEAFPFAEDHADGMAHIRGFLDGGGDPEIKLTFPL